MEVQKPNNFEDEWRRVFEDASVPPSDALWGKIESELDKKKKRPFLFFLRPSLIATGLAAALVVVLGGILFFNKEATPPTAQNNPANTDTRTATVIPAPSQEATTLADNSSATQTLAQRSAQDNSFKTAKTSPDEANRMPNRSVKTALLAEVTTHNGLAAKGNNTNELSSSVISALVPNKTETDETKSLIAGLDRIEGKKYRYFGSRYTMNRNKLAFDAEQYEETDEKTLASNDSKFWVGVQSGVAPFDPNMKLSGLNTRAYSAANEYAQNSMLAPGSTDKTSLVSKPQNAIKSGIAVNNGIAVGYQLSKKWHLESGIRYLQGNSTLETNTYAFQNSGYVNTFLADYLLQNSAKDYVSIGSNLTNTVVADAAKFGNRYQYLMIPMQMGYKIGLTKNLGLNLLAGISTDIFLQNSISTDNGLVKNTNTINSDSKIYKPVNFSGLGGLRANYMISKHWQANIGTSYQRALFSGISSSTDLNMKLQMFGINYGVNYRF